MKHTGASELHFDSIFRGYSGHSHSITSLPTSRGNGKVVENLFEVSFEAVESSMD